MKKRVCVIFGGASSEYDISLMSASSVIGNLDKDLYEIINVGITKDGRWYRYYGGVEEILTNEWHLENCNPILINPSKKLESFIEIKNEQLIPLTIDVVFPVLHGKYGEDGSIQGLLEIIGIPYIGCGVASSAICMDKDYAHKLVDKEGIKVPKNLAIDRNLQEDEVLNFIKEVHYPVYIKPANEGSSIGMTKAESENQLFMGIKEAFRYDNKVVLEENIDGFEVGCAIIGKEELIVGTVDELEVPDGFFDFEEKYSLVKSKIHVPARIDEDLKQRIVNTGKDIYRILGCSGLSRVDMFVDRDKNIFFNEVNTMPGFTTGSRFPNMLLHSHMSYIELLNELIEMELGN